MEGRTESISGSLGGISDVIKGIVLEPQISTLKAASEMMVSTISGGTDLLSSGVGAFAKMFTSWF